MNNTTVDKIEDRIKLADSMLMETIKCQENKMEIASKNKAMLST